MTPWLNIRRKVSLNEVVSGRDNNLNLIRFVAATMVLVSHSFAIYTGNPAAEPWRNTLGISMGGVAVDIFFCASGFLVAGSLLASQSARDFLVARALRIYPGLWVALLLTVLVVGTVATTEPAGRFFTSFDTWKYLIRNAVMVAGGEFQLPGAFTTVPFKGAVNGSLWTLPFELRAYLILLAIWLVVARSGRPLVPSFSGACALAAVAITVWAIGSLLSGHPNKFATLLTVFLFGALFRLIGRKIVLSLPAAMAMVASLAFVVLFDKKFFLFAYLFALPYLLMCLVYLPAGAIRVFNSVGDYSYGIYIYAFPIQQLLMVMGMSSVIELIFVSFLLTLIASVFSWHVVEKRALALRELARRK